MICWLEGIIENHYAPNLQKENGKYSIAYGNEELLCMADNPIDACVEMIIKLHELDVLWKWNSQGNKVLPLPETPAQMTFHLADYLWSRKDVNMYKLYVGWTVCKDNPIFFIRRRKEIRMMWFFFWKKVWKIFGYFKINDYFCNVIKRL